MVLALPGAPLEDEKRFIAATIAGVRVINVYVPNGQAVGSPKFFYKLAWLQALQTFVATAYTSEDVVLLCGDFNIAPEARDVYDATQAEGQILFHPDERAAFARLLAWGCAIPSVCIARKAGCIAGGITGPGVPAQSRFPYRPHPGDTAAGSALYHRHARTRAA